MTNHTVSRRDVLRGIAGTAVVAGLGTTGLAACTTNSDSANQTTTRSGVELPAYIAYTGVKPDLPATTTGAQPAFFAYPAQPKAFTSEKPMSGGSISAAAIINEVVKPRDENRYWQELESRLGASVKIIGAPTKDFGAKLATILAGGDIPDIVQMYQLNQLPGILKSGFQDLTEFLSGDAVKDYPALANIPTVSWESCIYNGGIYGVPQHRTPQKWSLIVRDDIARDLGVDIEPKNGDEFLDMFRKLSDPRNNHWAERSPMNMVNYINQMLGTPNTWRIDGGKFVRDYATDEMRQALSIVATMWKDQMFHPDSFASVSKQITTWISNGTVRMVSGPGAFYPSAKEVKKANPAYSVTPIRPPKWEGGGFAKQYLGPALLTISAMKKASKERITELLKVMNYLAAPFGTEESTFISYGIEGHNYKRENGEPVPIPGSELFNIGYVMSPPRVHYLSGYPEIAKSEYETEKSATDEGVAWPTAGLYSNTDETKGVALDKKMSGLMGEIIRGRPLKDWDEAVTAWKRDGGDTIAAEYEKSLQEAETTD